MHDRLTNHPQVIRQAFSGALHIILKSLSPHFSSRSPNLLLLTSFSERSHPTCQVALQTCSLLKSLSKQSQLLLASFSNRSHLISQVALQTCSLLKSFSKQSQLLLTSFSNRSRLIYQIALQTCSLPKSSSNHSHSILNSFPHHFPIILTSLHKSFLQPSHFAHRPQVIL